MITTETEYDRLRATVEELISRDEDDLSAEEVNSSICLSPQPA